ncbi:MAG: hypothetical protein PQJ46_14150 [Spirochaetales bacterium]|nr:hypothetical protein [Spirochaetales bacterium]
MKKGPCTCQNQANKEGCDIHQNLLCRHNKKETQFMFFMMLPFYITSFGGLIKVGMGLWIIPWVAYITFFFIIIEGNIICGHCPYYDMPGKTLKCPGNYGVPKLFKYKPGPMSKAERILFIITAFSTLMYPVVLLTIAKEYLLVAIAAASIIQLVLIFRKCICNRCVNFSCPNNTTDKSLKDAYFAQNTTMSEAWKKAGALEEEST